MHAQAEHGDMFDISSLEDNNVVKFFKAAQSGDITTVKVYLDLSVPVDLTDEDSWSPVHHAIAHGPVEVIRLLMDRGCCISVVECRTQRFHCTRTNIGTQSCILDAARSGDTIKLEECLDLGVPVDLTDEDGWSPVHHAIAHGQVEVIRLLMDRGCRMVPVKNSNLSVNEGILKDGDTGGDIFDAARSGDITTVKGCLDQRVSVDQTDEDGWSPVHHAISHGQVEVIRLLMDRGCRMSPVKSRIPPSSDYAGVHNSRKCGIFDAARSGDTTKLKKYLELGVSVDVTDEDGRTLLYCAAGEGQVDAVKLLIEKGCCIDPVDKNGWTPSMYATMQAQYEVVLLLYLAKCMRDSTGWTLLHVAARDGLLEAIEMLLSVGGKKLMKVVAGEAGTPLHQASRHGHKDVVTRLLNEGCPIDIRDSNGFTALYVAAQRGHVVIVEMLVNHGFDVNVVDNEGMTPLHSAANHGQLESVHTLLRLGGRKSLTKIANTPGDPLHLAVIHGQLESVNTLLRSGGRELPTKTVKVGGTPLHQAAGMGHKKIVTLLLNEGCPIGIRDNHGNSALHLAACFGRVHVIEELVMHGLHVNVEDYEGCTPLHSAAAHGQLESVHTLLKLGGRKSLTKIARNGGTLLHQAVASGNKELVTLLLNEGCPVTTLSCSGASVLHVAAQFGQKELIGYLIDCGLDANIEDDDGRTPLHHAAILDQLESVRALLRLGGRRAMTMVARGAGTPLHFAVKRGNKDIVSLLLSEGCPVNMTITDGHTALHIAAETGQVDIIEMLVGQGLAIDIQEDGGPTPLHLAAYRNQLESARTLIRLGGRRSMTVIADGLGTPLHQAAAEGHADMVSLLLEEGCPINVIDDNGQSAVHFAATSGEVGIIEMLENHGLDVNLVDNKGCTPLHAAAAQGQLESVRTLLRLGGKASMTMVAGKYGTPLHQAIAKGSHGMVTLLLDEDCPVNVKTCDGLTALHSAARKERVDLIDLLVKRGFDANAVDVYGWTPSFYGIFHIELLHRLRMSGARIPPLSYALHLELMKRLFLFGARISHHDNFGIKLYEYFIAFACVSSHTIKSYVEASGIACDGRNFANIISTLSKNHLIDINRVLCLAAVSGHVDLFDDIVNSDLPLDQQRMPNLLQALCIRLEDWEVIDNSLEDFHILDDRLNPLHLSLISCKQFGPGAQSAAQHKYAERVIFHPRTKYTVHELFSNGLSPLDIARQFELHDIAGMIEKAGGRPGIWADLPKEMGEKTMEILRSLKRVRGSKFDEDYFRTLLMMCGCVIKEEEGSKGAQNAVLEQTPEQSDVEEYVLSKVKELRKWRRVGELLKVDVLVLDKLAKVADDINDAYYSMLKYWLEHGRNVPRKTLLDAIGHFETKKTIDDISKKMERGILSVINIPTSHTMLPSLSHDISYVKVTTGVVPSSPVPPGGTQRRKARNAADANILTVDNLWNLVGKNMHSRWKEFAVHLHVETRTTDVVYKQCLAIVEDCFKELTRRWLRSGDGTGDLPRTWETVLKALKLTGFPLLVEDIREALSKECSGVILKELCWFPFGIQNVEVGPEGGQFFLGAHQPVDSRRSIDSYTYVEVPADAVEEGKIVYIDYGITPNGPFSFPDGYKLCSMVVYLSVHGAKLRKPMILHIPHWVASTQTTNPAKEDLLRCSWAPHTLEEGHKTFEFSCLDEQKCTMTSRAGEILIYGDNCLFADVIQMGTSIDFQYEYHVLREIAPLSDVIEKYVRIVITFSSFDWQKIVMDYYKPKLRGNWQAEEDISPEFTFKGDTLEAAISEERGSGWAIALNRQQVAKKNVDNVLSQATTAIELQEKVERLRYPPALICHILQSTPPHRMHSKTPRFSYLQMTKVRPMEHLKVPLSVVEWQRVDSRESSMMENVITSTGDLAAYYDKMTPHLTLLGTVLGIENHTAAVMGGAGSLQEKCIKILLHWINITREPTWQLFCDRLKRNTQFNGLSGQIEREHLS